jgi:hypothetical protein
MSTSSDRGNSPQRDAGNDPWTSTESLDSIFVNVEGVPDTTVRPRPPEIPLEPPRPQRPKKKRRKKKPPDEPPPSGKK